MVSKFLSKYYPYSKALQLRIDIFNFQQFLAESVFEAWERFKSCLRKCPYHRILLVDQILMFYHGITMIDREKIMMVVGGNIMRPGHPHTVYYSNSNESDKDEPSEADKSKINPLIREPPDAFLMGDKEIKFNPLKDIDDPIPIPRVSEKPLDSLDLISNTFDMTITNPLFDLDSEFTLNSNNPIFDIQNEESDESETETIMEERIPSDESKVQRIENKAKTVCSSAAGSTLHLSHERSLVRAELWPGGSLTWQYKVAGRLMIDVSTRWPNAGRLTNQRATCVHAYKKKAAVKDAFRGFRKL
ncbi:reverse transcriptase domain-containing protein [Tanacetum coccineum]